MGCWNSHKSEYIFLSTYCHICKRIISFFVVVWLIWFIFGQLANENISTKIIKINKNYQNPFANHLRESNFECTTMHKF